jgi:hypothetical protein
MKFKSLKWTGENNFEIFGVKFKNTLSDYAIKTTASEVVMLKDKGFLNEYQRILKDHKINRLLEFGIWEGGSPLFYGLASNITNISAIDIREPNDIIAAHIKGSKLGNRVKLHWNTSQSDEEKVSAIIQKDFHGLPLDVVIDDASHQYSFTRAAFEIAFPRLRPGGLYVIEDWPWAHYGLDSFDEPEWLSQTSLTNLIFELTMVVGSHPEMIARIEVTPYFTVVTKGNTQTPPNFSLTDLIRFGKRKFVPF